MFIALQVDYIELPTLPGLQTFLNKAQKLPIRKPERTELNSQSQKTEQSYLEKWLSKVYRVETSLVISPSVLSPDLSVG